MGVTHIFRADEFISSVPNYLAIYEALEIERPLFATLPPIMASDGKKKLGKRDGAKDILGYRDDGYLPEAVLNFLGLIGWNPGTEQELFTPQEYIEAFSVDKIQSAGGKFNEEKLQWTNKEYMKKLPDAEFKEYLFKFLPEKYRGNDAVINRLIPLLRERLSYFGELAAMDAAGDLSYFFEDPSYEKEMLLCAPKMRKGKEEFTLQELAPNIQKTIELLKEVPITVWSETTVKEAVWPHAEAEGRGLVLWAMRVALSGKERSPDPFELSYILGKDLTLERLFKAVKSIQ
jgi:glutamyl/glutaminyl-tRNA synthetase